MGNHMELSSNQLTNHPNVEQGAESLAAVVPSRLNTTETDQKSHITYLCCSNTQDKCSLW